MKAVYTAILVLIHTVTYSQNTNIKKEKTDTTTISEQLNIVCGIVTDSGHIHKGYFYSYTTGEYYKVKRRKIRLLKWGKRK